MDVYDSLDDFIGSLGGCDRDLGFLFESEDENAGLLKLDAIQSGFRERVALLKEEREFKEKVAHLLYEREDIAHPLQGIESFLRTKKVQDKYRLALEGILNIALSKILFEIVSHEKASYHPQNLRHVLSSFSERTAQFLLIIESLLRIIPDQHRFALEERGRAARTLINNYDIETLFIYIACHPHLKENDKEGILSWLVSFQKIYRRLQDYLYIQRQDKEKVAGQWFESSLSTLKEKGVVPLRDYQVPEFVRKLLSHFIENNWEEFLRIGKALVLVINNEDILRVIRRIINEDDRFSEDQNAVREIYRRFFFIMQEYREICIGKKRSEIEIKGKFAAISRERRITEEVTPGVTERIIKTPILGRRTKYDLLSDSKRHIQEGNLHHLFEIWPIPPVSQEIFNAICGLKEKLPDDPDIQFNQLLFQEKILEFLMRLERLGISVVKDPRLPIITNAFQLNAFNQFSKGLYLGSTGCWQCPNQIPPSVIYCTNPHSIMNCLGHKERHLFLRIFLGTGEFYESPFILDSTLRYGSVDEEGLLDGLVIRPGIFLLHIPDEIQKIWRKTEHVQLATTLDNTIRKRIAFENSVALNPGS
ncbi:MAG: hypothetical protein GY849_06870 [Deltaproteobacteria bacterium]|nr:hypothetical protein [Deltaproteobacteria bacterium]